MTFIGADTDQLRDLGTRMRQGMLRLQEQQSQITRAVAAADWHGEDAEEFRGRALSEVVPAMQRAQDDLLRRANDLVRQAAEQDEASDPRGFWQKLNDLLHWPAQITRTIRNVQKIATSIPKMLEHFRDGKAGLRTLKDLLALRKRFPHIVWSEYKAIAKEWDEVLNGKGWEKLGDFIPQKLSKYLGVNIPGKEWAGKALSHLDEITDATKPWVKVGSKSLGKFLPGLDIGLGVHQIATGDTYDKVSGSLSVASGGLVLAAPLFGPAAPIVAGVGVGLGVVSAGMDIGRTLYENVPAVKNVVDGTVSKVGEGLGAVGHGIKSLFG
ncbi:hypothetical protein Bra3105_07660 [Brachybacterium halotolerans subsp. kimchii]|uniref:WXG100 family type VII secretion target n=1 Tax=Brachybacterium halotolerans TaxID=2795215 RepID=UPI001E4AA975|nr:hypothetical protein [Brachybacterium halotolerans]UEJ84169.1 hypothetical protein Bra3105_07660 [Brachybacterium halotolerans subsp. kimchii]